MSRARARSAAALARDTPVLPAAESRAEPPPLAALTPLMRQYHRVKRAHGDAILVFRLGDFYEMFHEDAEIGAAVLGLTLTSRNNGKARRVPLAGFPAKAAETYIRRLIAAGYRVAVCEQMEDPKLAKGLVKREVVEVVTPGAVLDDALLDRSTGNYLVGLASSGARIGMAFADISTGEFWLGEVSIDEAAAELERMSPAEILVPASWCEDAEGRSARLGEVRRAEAMLAWLRARDAGGLPRSGAPLTVRDDGLFDPASARERLLRHLGTLALAGFGIPEESPAVAAAGATVAYLAEVQPQGVRTLTSPRWIRRDEILVVDEATLRNLEVFDAFQPGAGRRGTLLGALDSTLTAPGARLLRSWLLRPPNRWQPIVARQEAVAFLRDRGERARIREQLRRITDIPRVVGRCVGGRALPRELAGLREALERVPAIAASLEMDAGSAGRLETTEAGLSAEAPIPALLGELREQMRGFEALREDLARALVDDPPVAVGEGAVIRAGYDPELDRLREVRASGHGWIGALQQRERERTGIGSLKVGFNRVFGYFIEVTRPNLAQVPTDYVRKQTIAGAERFVTPELKEMEAQVLGAEEKIGELELALLGRIRGQVAEEANRLQRLGEALAALDILAAFAETAAERGWSRPEICSEDLLEIRGGRHPVVEMAVGVGGFVPNDTLLDDARRIMILTGPNMAGKSTYLRQVGLIALLAHTGSFVPAESARIGLMDRIFTRVGASDDLARGRSTFLVEMVETANILRNATSRSLVLLDEIGRGTATFDGLSLAWAVTEHLHGMQAGAPRTVFATHYHELTELATLLPRVFNAHAQVREWGEEIVFLKKVADGKSDRSYGIQVARLAGVPEPVVTRAREILANLESGEFSATGVPRRSCGRSAPAPPRADQISIFELASDPLREELRTVDLEAMRPLDALSLLAEWKRRYAN